MQTNTAVAAQTGEFLTFFLAGEEYGIDILNVQEIKRWGSVTRIPKVEDYVLGVINLRGTVVPVMDMRARFGMERIATSASTVVIVVRVMQADVERRVGLVVDAVSEVYQLNDQSVQPPPDLVTGARASFVRGLATVDSKMIILLDTQRLISFDVGAVQSEAAVATH
jgi:purine-binding chemotaxis protein CheW